MSGFLPRFLGAFALTFAIGVGLALVWPAKRAEAIAPEPPVPVAKPCCEPEPLPVLARAEYRCDVIFTADERARVEEICRRRSGGAPIPGTSSIGCATQGAIPSLLWIMRAEQIVPPEERNTIARLWRE